MEIVAVDCALLDLGAADGDESDAVALSCVEWLLAETNACFQQRQLAQKAVQLSSSRLRDSILSVVFAASLRADLPLNATRFNGEAMPQAEVKDRHAVRSVPLRSEAVVEGPDWVEAASTMSRKRFEVCQPLNCDAISTLSPLT
ncbi:hypothetical protein BBJ28_00000702 [Nothophytophthora sp. Chile5]|nr:hypothetical protein BBJ28_00000702 [Nothophytophthora sp. Chile5]